MISYIHHSSDNKIKRLTKGVERNQLNKKNNQLKKKTVWEILVKFEWIGTKRLHQIHLGHNLHQQNIILIQNGHIEEDTIYTSTQTCIMHRKIKQQK